uniref:Doublecortin domain-containing protein n=1 Tax=Oryzias latipes TaxID=8090 RepID=A0A3P9J3V0_ORYLA
AYLFTLPDHSSGSGHTFDTPRQPSVVDPIISKRVCFYKSGDPQFNGLRIVINNRTFKTFEALLDSLSKKVPLPFGVRNITTPRGVHGIHTLEDFEDGKSYICSDSRKVKPINLALARKKLPPWYHARPVSSRRQTVQQARLFPGRGINRQEAIAVRTPKKLVVFRNGDPSVRHTVVLHKKTTPSYESILDYISELMQFHVVKLYTPDGRRVSLIMCSGTVVAVGREPFRPAVYSGKKSPFPPRRPNNRTGNRSQKIHNSIAESSYCPASDPAKSVELESNCILESAAETEGNSSLADESERQDGLVPSDDNIEKSFRVNQDGSMTVEMKVRLTIKEEETIHWTTTLKRSNVADQLQEAEPELCSDKADSLGLPSAVDCLDTFYKDKTTESNNENGPSLSNGAFSSSSKEEDDTKNHTDVVSSWRAPTPGLKKVSKQHTSVESTTSVTPDGIQEEIAGSYSYQERTENGTVMQQYCMVKESSTKPVPKPRRRGSVDVNSRNISETTASKRTGILLTESSEEEITETVLHICEQQACQDNYLANVCIPAAGFFLNRPATPEKRQLSSNNDFKHELLMPRTDSESTWKDEKQLCTSRSHLAPLKMQGTKKIQFHKSSRDNGQQKEVSKNTKVSSKPTKIKKPLLTRAKKQKQNSAEAQKSRKKGKTFSSAGSLKRIYGKNMKSAKSMKKIKKRKQSGEKYFTREHLQESDGTIRTVGRDSNIPLLVKGKISAKVSFDTNSVSLSEVTKPRGVLRHQTSTHMEKRSEKESHDINESKILPAFNSSSSVTGQYVETWLEKSYPSPLSNPTQESILNTNGSLREKSEKINDFVIAAMQERTLEIQKYGASEPLQESVKATPVQMKVQSFEKKSNALTPNPHKPLANGICSEKSPQRTEALTETTEGDMDEYAIPSYILSMELPPPPPEFLNTDESSAASTPLYRLSSTSSQTSDPFQSSLTPMSPIDNTTDKPGGSQTNIPSTPKETQQSKTSVKRAPLVSNVSLERKLSLRKARLDENSLDNHAPAETTLLPPPLNTWDGSQHEILSSGTGKDQLEETLKSVVNPICTPSVCTSPSPASSASYERKSSASVSSSEASVSQSITNQTLEKKTKLKSSPSPERKPQQQKDQNNSPKLPPVHSHSMKKTVIPNIGKDKHATRNIGLSPERKPYKTKVQLTPSVRSQSLDVASPPVKHKTNKKLNSRNLSLDNPADPKSTNQDKTSPPRKNHQASQSILPRAGAENAALSSEFSTADRDKSETNRQTIQQSLNTAKQPNMKPVLEKLCYSIKSIRQMTQNKRPSCLEKSNSLPDFSSHVASTFGSSSKALLAFLSVMTLKEGLTSLNVNELNANNVSCAEALRMIDSLREIASIEDSHRLKTTLSVLQQSASKELLKSWRGFQELEDRCKSRSSTPAEQEFVNETSLEHNCAIEGNAIDEIMGNLDIPTELKEELASLSDGERSESNNEGEISARTAATLDTTPNSGSQDNCTGVVVQEVVPQSDEALIDVKSIIKKFSDNHKPKQELTESVKQRPNGQKTTNSGKNGLDSENELQATKPSFSQIPEQRQLCSLSPTDLEPSRGVGHQDSTEQMKESKDVKFKEEGTRITKEVISQTHCFTTEEQGGVKRQLKSKQPVTENLFPQNDQTDEEGQKMLRANKDSNQKESSKQRSAKAVAYQMLKQESSGGENLANAETEKQFMPNSSVDLIIRSKKSTEGGSACESQASERQQHVQTSCMGLSISTDESAGTSEGEESSSEEERPASDLKKLQVIVEEHSSGNEEEEEELICNPPKVEAQGKKSKELEALIEEAEEDQESSGEEGAITCQPKGQNTLRADLRGDRDLYIIEDKGSLTLSDSVGKGFQFNKDDDSGNDHSSCEELGEEELHKTEGHHISSSAEEDTSYFEKESISEEEQTNIDIHVEESCVEHEKPSGVEVKAEGPQVSETFKQNSAEIKTQTVAERVILLEKQVAEAQKAMTTPCCTIRHFSQRKSHLDSDGEGSPSQSPSSELVLCTRSAPQSSLSFSYDSSGVITMEPEGSRVRSIREMFLARSNTDIQQRRFQSQNSSEISELRAETSCSGGYQSQTTSDVSSGEDDSARKSITRGFVRRTIERLYGNKDASAEEPSDRPPSEPNQEKKEQSSIFSPFHAARSKAMSELSYFSSTKALDAFSEATRCIAFNAQVVPGDSFSTDYSPLLIKENTMIRKSASDPVGINKSFKNATQEERLQKDTEEDAPYSLFSSQPEIEDKTKSQPTKCTYFSLPHASDSDICQDDLSTASKSSMTGDGITEAKGASEGTKTWTERNGMLPGVGITDFKMMDNKVHPLVEHPPEGEVVVVQPRKGQGIVNRRLQEPDVLDLLYNFCGEHCPLL